MGVVHVLGNPAAGGGGDLDAVVARVRGAGHEAIDLTGGDPAASLERLRSTAIERLVVVGGDGLVPQGTGNDFARALGLLGRSLDDAIDAALAPPTAVDGLWSEAGWVATVATLGFAGDVTERANALSWPRGQSVYTVATVLQLPRLRTIALRLTVDGTVHEVETVLLAIGNTAYFGGGMQVCPGAHPDDGQFQIAIIGPVSRRAFIRVFPKVFKGGHVTDRRVTMLEGTELSIDNVEVEIWADGDPLGPAPMRFEARPGALKVAGAQW